MTIPDYILMHLVVKRDFQVNIEYDSSGNEIYWGVAINGAANDGPNWIICKSVYTTDTAGMLRPTHISFLRDQIWANRASIIFP